MGDGIREVIRVSHFNLRETIDSGQVFHWFEQEDEGFRGVIGEQLVSIRQVGTDLEISAGHESLVRHYFGLDDRVDEILASFPEDDQALRMCVERYRGLRILRQDPWECLATFITSSLKQVAHIRLISLELREKYGKTIQCPETGRDYFSYPRPEVLASVGESELRRCGMGYRAKSLALAAERISAGEIDLEDIGRTESDCDAREILCSLHGVGEKIANCVLLFGFGRLAIFPVDVWMERVLRERYLSRRRARNMAPLKPEEVRRLAEKRFGAYAGYAQQYLFHYARKNHKSGQPLFPRESTDHEG